jgi:hypothetical protein
VSGQNGLSIDPTKFAGSIAGKYDPLIGASSAADRGTTLGEDDGTSDGVPFAPHALPRCARIATAAPPDGTLIACS